MMGFAKTGSGQTPYVQRNLEEERKGAGQFESGALDWQIGKFSPSHREICDLGADGAGRGAVAADVVAVAAVDIGLVVVVVARHAPLLRARAPQQDLQQKFRK